MVSHKITNNQVISNLEAESVVVEGWTVRKEFYRFISKEKNQEILRFKSHRIILKEIMVPLDNMENQVLLSRFL